MPEAQDFPETIETERLLLRVPVLDDAPKLAEAVIESLPELSQWLPWATSEYSEGDARMFISQVAREQVRHTGISYMLHRKGDDLMMGSVGLHDIVWEVPRFEVGYWLRSSATNSGYMTEAAGGLIAMVFERLGAERVEIRCDARNLRSAGVAERLGFQLEGTLRHNMVATDGTLRDSRVYGMIRGEW